MSSCGFRTPNQRGRSILALCFLSASVLASFGAARPMRGIREGTWGGEHVRIKVAGDSVTIEYDCAHGTINGPLLVDSVGRFALSGTHQREHGGPDPSRGPARRAAGTVLGMDGRQ